MSAVIYAGPTMYIGVEQQLMGNRSYKRIDLLGCLDLICLFRFIKTDQIDLFHPRDAT